jgi:peptidyl-prolyl cis-trans isomerase C
MQFLRSSFSFSFISLLCGLSVLLASAPLAPAASSKRNRSAAKPKASPTPAPASSPAADLTPDKVGADAPAASPSAVQLPEVVAIVNGESIKREELERVFNALLSANGRNPAELSDKDRKKGYRSVLDEMVTDRLVAKLSTEIPAPDADVEKRLDAIRQGFASPAAFEEELNKTGQTLEQVKKNIHVQVQQQLWIEAKIADLVKVTPEDVDKFYKDNPERFNMPEMVRASHILLAVRRDAAPEIVLEKEKLLASLAERIKKGESFEELAKQYSDDPNAKQTGGDLDYFSRERIMPEFAEAAFKLKPNEISAPVRTQFGLHLIKLTDHKDPRTATLEEARPQIAAYLQESKRREAISRLLASLRDNSQIDIKLP